MNAHEENSRQIARELHDDFSQRLAVLNMTIEKIRLEPSQGKHSVSDKTLGVLQSTVSGLLENIHTLSRRMHPAELEQLGLVPALKG